MNDMAITREEYFQAKRSLADLSKMIDTLWREAHPGVALPEEFPTKKPEAVWQCSGCQQFLRDVRPEPSGLCAGCDTVGKIQKTIPIPPEMG